MNQASSRHRAHSESASSDGQPLPQSSSTLRKPAPHGLRYLDNSAQKFAHTSTFKSPEMTIKINSPSVRIVRRTGQDSLSLPIFGDSDHVAGTVTLDPQNCASESGRLTISIEGVFEYVSPMNASKPGPSQIYPGKHKHVFYQDSAVIPLYVASEPPTRRPFRSAFTATLRRATSSDIMRPAALKQARSMDFRSNKGSDSGRVSASPKAFNFDFALPKSNGPGDELPPTFSSSNVVSAGVRGRVYAENADVKYRVKVLWEALDGSGGQAQLEAQILFQPDTDFQSLDGLNITPESWSETPLSKVNGMPVECAITIPNPTDFPRSSSIPYFVIFTTTPRSRSLSAEIMADATIAVSLVRRVGFERPTPMRLRALTLPSSSATTGTKGTQAMTIPTIPTTLTMSTSSSTFEQPSPTASPTISDPGMPSVREHEGDVQVAGPSRERSGSGGQRLLQRVVRSAPPILSGFRLSRADPDGAESPSASSSRKGSVDKPLPTIPQLFNGFNGFNTSQGSTRLRSGSKSKPPSPTSSSASSSGGSTFSSVSSIATSVHSDKQLTTDGPEIAPQRVTDSRTLHTDVSVGFPKRPKGRSRAGSHPSLETVSALPDGLYKGNIPLQKGWFPSIHWRGLRIEYFLQVSVIFDNAEFKAQVPLRVY